MHMVVFAIHLHKLRFEVQTHGGKDRLRVVQDSGGKDLSAIFGHKDQISMKCKDTVPAASIVVAFIHRANKILE